MCLIIAEVGENHLGDMNNATRLIDISKEANFDYVKFQYYDYKNCSDSDPEKKWFSEVQLDKDKLKYLYNYSLKKDIQFLCTPWDASKAQDIFDLGVKDMKIASFHITDIEMLKVVNQRAERVFLSTGMSSQEEIDRAVDKLDSVDLYLLHCVSEYPLAEERANIKTMDWLRDRYKCKVGYSDHTLNILACMVAIARGADVVEKHVTLSKTAFGTDHILSADPLDMKMLGEYAKRITSLLGDGKKFLTQIESRNQEFLRNRFSFNKL